MQLNERLELVCPTCRSRLDAEAGAVVCAGGHRFPAFGATYDFLPGGGDVDSFHPPADHAREEAGAAWRVGQYLLPALDRELGAAHGQLVLDDGCGIGAVVGALVEKGVEAYGIDPGTRAAKWAASSTPDRLFRADGVALPFADGAFDAIVSSGVLEHLGEPHPFAEREPFQVGYFREALRVLRPGGVALMGAPNGAHPIDFWHSRKPTTRGPMRVHIPYEQWMPNAPRLRRWIAQSGYPADVAFLSPENYLSFERVRKQWVGRAFTSTMRATFRSVSRLPRLATSPINPWLMVCIRKR